MSSPNHKPEGLQSILNDVYGCPTGASNKAKRQFNWGCVLQASEDLLAAAQLGGPLHDLALVQGNFPAFRDSDASSEMQKAISYASELDFGPGFDSGNVGRMAFGLGYNAMNGRLAGGDNYFPASIIVVGPGATAPATTTGTETQAGCPTTLVFCPSSDCGAQVSTTTCEVRQPWKDDAI